MMQILSVLALAATFSLAGATPTGGAAPIYNPAVGKYMCPIPNGVYCVGGNIILRCKDGWGQPGNCNDNLAGEPPLGGLATCYASTVRDGSAACAKNCIVYGSSGNINGTFPQPHCTPVTVTSAPATTTTAPPPPPGLNVTITTTVTTTDFTTYCPSPTTLTYGTLTYTVTAATTVTIPCPHCTVTKTTTTAAAPTTTLIVPPPPPPPATTTTTSASYPTWTLIPTGTATGTGAPSPPTNGTLTTFTPGTSATNVPTGPASTTTAPPHSGADLAKAPGAGLLVAALAVIAASLL